MTTYNEVFDAAQGLPADDQLRLIEALWAGFPSPVPSEEWIAESQRRTADYDAGKAAASPWSDVQTRARKKAGLDG
jgi:putative addiction module component (TIGR02574 family)